MAGRACATPAEYREATRNEQLVNAGPLSEEISKANDDVVAAENRARTVREMISKCAVESPIDGTILRVWMRKGEAFSTIVPTPLFTIADLSERRVRAEVDERDVANVALGQHALIETDPPSRQSYAAHVSWMADAFGHKKVLADDPSDVADRDVLEVLVTPENANVHLPIDMRVTVKFFPVH